MPKSFLWDMLARLLPRPTTAAGALSRGPAAARAVRSLSSALGVPLPVAPAAEVKPGRTAQAFYRNLPVSPKKLRVVANLTPKLYWREAMMQLEFCRKQMAVMVKNAIESAAGNAEAQGLSKERLVVGEHAGPGPSRPHTAAAARANGLGIDRLCRPTPPARRPAPADEVVVNKGKHFKKMDIKARGKTGIRKTYFSHLRVVLREVAEEEVGRTQHFGKWRPGSKLNQLLALPWAERVKHLPRYKPLPGYDPHG